MYQKPPSKHT
ncbi:bacterial regulatory s, luxR family protein, partial [Vibrio parahaemolyticus V-223/04]